VPQARTLFRSAIESLFTLTAIAKDSNFLDDLLAHHVAEQRRFAKNVRRWQHPELKTIAESEMASGRLQKYLDSNGRQLTTEEIARRAGLEDWYRTVYMVFSWSTHGAAMDLDRHAVVGDDGQILELRNEPETEDQDSSWLCAVEILLEAASSLSVIFKGIDKAKLEQCYAEAHALKASVA
jgi:hypothetical protein